MALDHFTVEDDCAFFRPMAEVEFGSLMSLFEQALAECKRVGVVKLLVDATRLRHAPITDTTRFTFGEALAAKWDRSIRLVLVVRPDQMDQRRFAVLVAQNRGLTFGAYTTEEEGRAWLRS